MYAFQNATIVLNILKTVAKLCEKFLSLNMTQQYKLS